MQSLLGEEADAFFKSLAQPPPVGIRMNPFKPSETRGQPIPWCQTGRWLSLRPAFTLDPLFHAGAYYVQEPSSMFLEQMIRTVEPVRVLDLCAAPGGKSTHLLSMLPAGSLLVSNETIRSRVPALRQNLARWGQARQVITCSKPADFASLPGFFDLIVCDAPCSGEGLFRKDAEAAKHWSEEAVEFCSSRQRSIVKDVWPALKTGGQMVYSTCTYNMMENEENMDWICEALGATDQPLPGRAPEGVVAKRLASRFRFYPHRINGEGFFAGMIIKNSDDQSVAGSAGKSFFKKADDKILKAVSSWIAAPHRFEFFNDDRSVYFIEKSLAGLVKQPGRLRIQAPGTRAAIMKGDFLQPAPELALSSHLYRDAFFNIELNHDQALDFLRGGTRFPFAGDSGYCLMSYRGHALGFSKKSAGRFNNLYPKGWYIRTSRGL